MFVGLGMCAVGLWNKSKMIGNGDAIEVRGIGLTTVLVMHAVGLEES